MKKLMKKILQFINKIQIGDLFTIIIFMLFILLSLVIITVQSKSIGCQWTYCSISIAMNLCYGLQPQCRTVKYLQAIN